MGPLGGGDPETKMHVQRLLHWKSQRDATLPHLKLLNQAMLEACVNEWQMHPLQ